MGGGRCLRLPLSGGSEPPMAVRIRRDAVPSLVVGALLLVALTLVGLARFRRGSTVLAGALLIVAALRMVLTPEQMGPLTVRSRPFDVLFCTGLAAAIMTLVLID